LTAVRGKAAVKKRLEGINSSEVEGSNGEDQDIETAMGKQLSAGGWTGRSKGSL